jgi:hypothetical protein
MCFGELDCRRGRSKCHGRACPGHPSINERRSKPNDGSSDPGLRRGRQAQMTFLAASARFTCFAESVRRVCLNLCPPGPAVARCAGLVSREDATAGRLLGLRSEGCISMISVGRPPGQRSVDYRDSRPRRAWAFAAHSAQPGQRAPDALLHELHLLEAPKACEAGRAGCRGSIAIEDRHGGHQGDAGHGLGPGWPLRGLRDDSQWCCAAANSTSCPRRRASTPTGCLTRRCFPETCMDLRLRGDDVGGWARAEPRNSTSCRPRPGGQRPKHRD